VGRKDWAPDSSEGVERIFTDRPITTVVLPRDKLVGVLHQHIVNNYGNQIELNYGCEVHPVDFDKKDKDGNAVVVVDVAKCEPTTEDRLNPSAVGRSGTTIDDSAVCDVTNLARLSTNFLIAADGTARTIANRMEEDDKQKRQAMNPIQRLFAGQPFSVKRYIDDNQRIYKTIPFKLPQGWRPDLNYSARSKTSRIVFDALPANRNGSFCGVLLLKKDDPLAQANSDPKELRQVFQDFLPQFSELLDDETIATVATKPPSFLPSFRYAGPRLHQGDRTLILGDCAHTVKPYFGLGANSALEDVRVSRRNVQNISKKHHPAYRIR
jgi:2-polyprenyl-6-methoxyphenol hydroxylase-like FAD-dependent oxidoreductase